MHLQVIQRKIHEIRGYKVILDFDIADLYETETKVLNQAIKRNIARFPAKFMFRLSAREWNKMRSQIVTASHQKRRNSTVTPYAFTEHGVAMLASVLKSQKAIKTNIAIVEAFIELKEFALNYKDVSKKLAELEACYDEQFKEVFQAIKYLLNKDNLAKKQLKRRKIGYKI